MRYIDIIVLEVSYFFFFFQAEDGIRDIGVTGVQTCALPIWDCSVPRPEHGGSTRTRSKPRPPSNAAASATRTSTIVVPIRAHVRSRAAARPEIGRASCRERV